MHRHQLRCCKELWIGHVEQVEQIALLFNGTSPASTPTHWFHMLLMLSTVTGKRTSTRVLPAISILLHLSLRAIQVCSFLPPQDINIYNWYFILGNQTKRFFYLVLVIIVIVLFFYLVLVIIVTVLFLIRKKLKLTLIIISSRFTQDLLDMKLTLIIILNRFT